MTTHTELLADAINAALNAAHRAGLAAGQNIYDHPTYLSHKEYTARKEQHTAASEAANEANTEAQVALWRIVYADLHGVALAPAEPTPPTPAGLTRTPLGYGWRCESCGTHVRADHKPLSEDCTEAARLRDESHRDGER